MERAASDSVDWACKWDRIGRDAFRGDMTHLEEIDHKAKCRQAFRAGAADSGGNFPPAGPIITWRGMRY